MMDKKTKTILMVIAAVVIIIALFIPYTEKDPEPIELTSFSCSDVSENQENDTKLNKISCQQYQDLTSSEEKNVILIARPTCGHCVNFIPILEEIVEEYDLAINYFNTDALSEEEISAFYSSSSLFESGFGTPTLLVTKDGKITRYQAGYKDKNTTVKFLKKAKIITDEN